MLCESRRSTRITCHLINGASVKERKRKDYRTAFNVGRLLIRVVTPRNVTHDPLRSLMIIFTVGRHLYGTLLMMSIRVGC